MKKLRASSVSDGENEVAELEWQNRKLAEFAGRLMVRIRELMKPKEETVIERPSEMTGRRIPPD